MNYLQKELYELIKSNNINFDFIEDAPLDGLWYWDLEKPENKWMNPKFWNTLGYNSENMQDEASVWKKIIRPEDLKTILSDFVKHCNNPKNLYDHLVPLKHENGSLVWIRSKGKAIRNEKGDAIRMLGINIEVTREKEKEEEEKLNNIILQSTMESFKDVLIFSIDRQYRYLVFNNAFKLATNAAYGTDVIKGMSMLDSITNEQDRIKAKENCDRAFEGETHITNEIYGDINLSYFETRYNPIINDKGEVNIVTVMSTNVTERKRAEEQLLALNKELESFSYSVSHDLRAPLRAVNGYAKMLEEDYASVLDKSGKNIIDNIHRNSNKMNTLIEDLLALSRLGKKEVKRSELNMKKLVEDVVLEINNGTKHNAKITVGDLENIKADSGLMRQVLLNLISNAVKYTSKTAEPLIEIYSETRSGETIFVVKDNGAGFDMAYAHKLFGVFQRLHTDKEFEGTGVGLAIVQRVINRHGGKVWAEGKVNEGAVFRFSIPKE